MKKKFLSVLLCAALCTGMLAGCGNSGKSSSGSSEELNLFIWSEYVTDEAIDGFEEEYGIKVNVQTFDSMEEGYAKMQNGAGKQYDLVQCNNTFAQGLIDQNLVQKIDFDNIPNYKNIEDSAKESTYDPNNEYTVPYMGGYSMVIYNKKNCPIEINSFKDLANPELKDQIVSVTASRTVIGMALASLGYDVNTTEESEIKEATDFLKSMKGNIKVFDGDSPSTELLNGECSVGIVYGGEAAKVMADMPDDFEVANIEAPILGKNDWFIPAGCAHKEAAEKFINYICDGKVMAQILDVYPYNNFNTAALDYVGEAYKNNKALNLSQEVMDAAKSTTDLGDADVLYDTYWNEFMAQ